jgi:hypothetical protein
MFGTIKILWERSGSRPEGMENSMDLPNKQLTPFPVMVAT